MKREVKAVPNSDYSVQELKVKELIQVVKVFEKSPDIPGALKLLEDLIPKAVPGLTLQDAEELAPSEITRIWETFQEVNAPFFKMAESVGLTVMLKAMKAQAMRFCLEQFSSSLSQDTSTPLTTPSVGSKSPRKDSAKK